MSTCDQLGRAILCRITAGGKAFPQVGRSPVRTGSHWFNPSIAHHERPGQRPVLRSSGSASRSFVSDVLADSIPRDAYEGLRTSGDVGGSVTPAVKWPFGLREPSATDPSPVGGAIAERKGSAKEHSGMTAGSSREWQVPVRAHAPRDCRPVPWPERSQRAVPRPRCRMARGRMTFSVVRACRRVEIPCGCSRRRARRVRRRQRDAPVRPGDGCGRRP